MQLHSHAGYSAMGADFKNGSERMLGPLNTATARVAGGRTRSPTRRGEDQSGGSRYADPPYSLVDDRTRGRLHPGYALAVPKRGAIQSTSFVPRRS